MHRRTDTPTSIHRTRSHTPLPDAKLFPAEVPRRLRPSIHSQVTEKLETIQCRHNIQLLTNERAERTADNGFQTAFKFNGSKIICIELIEILSFESFQMNQEAF